MTQGIFINGSRPKSKKQIKDYVEGMYDRESQIFNDPYGLVIEATSMFGNEFDGSLALAQLQMENPDGFKDFAPGAIYKSGQVINFVGPDPHTNRKFYGQIVYNPNHKSGPRWEVK